MGGHLKIVSSCCCKVEASDVYRFECGEQLRRNFSVALQFAPHLATLRAGRQRVDTPSYAHDEDVSGNIVGVAAVNLRNVMWLQRRDRQGRSRESLVVRGGESVPTSF